MAMDFVRRHFPRLVPISSTSSQQLPAASASAGAPPAPPRPANVAMAIGAAASGSGSGSSARDRDLGHGQCRLAHRRGSGPLPAAAQARVPVHVVGRAGPALPSVEGQIASRASRGRPLMIRRASQSASASPPPTSPTVSDDDGEDLEEGGGELEPPPLLPDSSPSSSSLSPAASSCPSLGGSPRNSRPPSILDLSAPGPGLSAPAPAPRAPEPPTRARLIKLMWLASISRGQHPSGSDRSLAGPRPLGLPLRIDFSQYEAFHHALSRATWSSGEWTLDAAAALCRGNWRVDSRGFATMSREAFEAALELLSLNPLVSSTSLIFKILLYAQHIAGCEAGVALRLLALDAGLGDDVPLAFLMCLAEAIVRGGAPWPSASATPAPASASASSQSGPPRLLALKPWEGAAGQRDAAGAPEAAGRAPAAAAPQARPGLELLREPGPAPGPGAAAGGAGRGTAAGAPAAAAGAAPGTRAGAGAVEEVETACGAGGGAGAPGTAVGLRRAALQQRLHRLLAQRLLAPGP
eukprot:tig00021312_g20088.t1